MNTPKLQGHFIASAKGRVFVTQHGEITDGSAILCLPSITEELNLARAVVAKQAQAFAAMGKPCFILDYYGTGDSEGEFNQASADIWQQDIISTCQWLVDQGITKITLWGVRFGALLMFANQSQLHQQFPIINQVVWKPVTNGKIFAGQFLRIKQANDMVNQSAEKVNWRQHVLDGNEVDVAGYRLTKDMLQSIEALVLANGFIPESPLHWFELAATEISPATKRFCQAIPDELSSIQTLKCPPFWQVPEVFDLPELSQLGLSQLGLNQPSALSDSDKVDV